MEIIRRARPTRRGPYAGGIGYYDVDGRVADSVPSLEYEETRNKARAVVRALEAARSRDLWL